MKASMKQSVEEFISKKVLPFAQANFPVIFQVRFDDQLIHESFFYGGFELDSRRLFQRLVNDESNIITILFQRDTLESPPIKLLTYKDFGHFQQS